MKVSMWAREACGMGGNATYNLVGQYLESGLEDYGGAITEIEVLACFRGGDINHPSLQTLFDEFHSRFLPSLPFVKLFRKKGRLALTYETHIVDATFLKRRGFLSIEIFAQVLGEIAAAFHLIDTRLKKSDDFDLARFHQDISRLVASAPQSDDELRAIKVKLEKEEHVRLAAMDPWDQLAIEWDEFHPSARSLLNDLFFWDSMDENSPHGNDTGADLLIGFTKWERRHSTRPAHEMARRLLRDWGVSQIDYDVVNEAAIWTLLQGDLLSLVETDEALIAAAFAAVKCRGCCDRETREIALKAIVRERLPAVIEGRGWRDATERMERLDLLTEKLRRVPERP